MCARVCVRVCVWPLITDSGVIKDFLLCFFSKNFSTNARALKREISVAAAGVLCHFMHFHTHGHCRESADRHKSA